jgi:hypothetical protein
VTTQATIPAVHNSTGRIGSRSGESSFIDFGFCTIYHPITFSEEFVVVIFSLIKHFMGCWGGATRTSEDGGIKGSKSLVESRD